MIDATSDGAARARMRAALLGGVTFLAVAAGAQEWPGVYTDRASYAPGETIRVYASAPSSQVVLRLVRLDADWTEISRTEHAAVGPQTSALGSFVEYPSVSLSGRTSFTLEGWVYPTLLGGDTVLVAGQLGLDQAAAGLGITPAGRPAAYVSDTPATDLSALLIGPDALELDTWTHLAMTYDGSTERLYVDGAQVAERAQSGAVAAVNVPFRLGARAEAPGDLTGVLDGRVDSWALWPVALSPTEIAARRRRGLDDEDPIPDLSQVELYLGFEGTYPGLEDLSPTGHVGELTNHGSPGVAGVGGKGHALRFNHDQIVDAGWTLSASIAIPPTTESGMYAVQALLGSPFEPTQSGDPVSARAIAIRPGPGQERAPIAVVLPTSTWTAYNGWPKGHQEIGSPISPRSRLPGGPPLTQGNNSAYGLMGDGASLAHFYGWRRPADTTSPIEPARADGYSVRAPNSMHLVRWLDDHGFDYDVYADEDLHAGRIRAADHRILMPHSHHEYWTDAMLDELTRFLNEGGSVIAPGGNMITWRVVRDADEVMEVRKYTKAPILGLADMQSGIDRLMMGTLETAAVCNGGDEQYALGTRIDLVKPCRNPPFCFGRWRARNTDHWLWLGSGLADGDRFGIGRVPGSFAVGHEADTWKPGLVIPGLAPGAEPVILADGTDYDPSDPGKRGSIEPPRFTCEQLMGAPDLERDPGEGLNAAPDDAGSILYFPHQGGGNVLVIGASATPWALESDPHLSGLLERGLTCFSGPGDLAGAEREQFFRTCPAATGVCRESPTSLCLSQGRFQVQVAWRDPFGTQGSGAGQAAPLSSDTGTFWFFDEANVELVVKVLDGRSLNGHFWVFYGALSNVEYTITVTDTETGRVKTYVNPGGEFGSRGDIEAFSAPGPSAIVEPLASSELESTAASAACTATATALCLNQSRFRIDVSWTDPFGAQGSGTGQAVPLTTDTGYFWFFDDANVELVIKVLDGRALNGHFWVFYGALSNVEYTITVTDTETGAQKVYQNAGGSFASVGDVEAIPGG